MEVLRRFHSFAGSGATYGFAEVSRQGLAAERACRVVVAEQRLPRPSELAAWRSYQDTIAHDLGEPAPPRASAIPEAPAVARRVPYTVSVTLGEASR